MNLRTEFFTFNGWIGLQRGSSSYFYNVIGKEVAVIKGADCINAVLAQRLKELDLLPEPNFIAEANAAAITLTTKCNMDCAYCYVKPVEAVSEFNESKVRETVRALTSQTKKELIIFGWGGEPTQNPKALIALAEEAQRYPYIKVSLISNGVINPELLKRLLLFDNIVFQISFDGLLNQEKQKPLLDQKKSAEKVLRTLEAISQVSRRVAVRATVTRHNVQELKETLVPLARRFTNRIMVEHLHTYNGRARDLKDAIPSVNDYVDLIFSILPSAEVSGGHVKVLPLDHLRSSGPNNKMNFLNILADGNVVVSNAVIHNTHPHFDMLHIGHIADSRLVLDAEKNNVLSKKYMDNFYSQCHSCHVKPICRGSVQRYLFLTNENLGDWDNSRCQFFIAVVDRWLKELFEDIDEHIQKLGKSEGLVKLHPPVNKIHYPMFIMEGGLSLSYEPFTEST